MREFLRECNNFHARWGRKKFILYPIYISLLVLPVSFLLLLVADIVDNLGLIIMAMNLVFFAYLYVAYVSFVAYVKRFHDFDKPGTYALLSFIPLLSFFVMLYCVFVTGTPGKNKYGSDPLGRPSLPKIDDSQEL